MFSKQTWKLLVQPVNIIVYMDEYTAFSVLWLLGSCDNVGLATHSAQCVCVVSMCVVKHGKRCQQQSDTSDLATSRNSPALWWLFALPPLYEQRWRRAVYQQQHRGRVGGDVHVWRWGWRFQAGNRNLFWHTMQILPMPDNKVNTCFSHCKEQVQSWFPIQMPGMGTRFYGNSNYLGVWCYQNKTVSKH